MLCNRWLNRLVFATAISGALLAPALAQAGWIMALEASDPLNWFQFEELAGDTFADAGSDPLLGKSDPGPNGPIVNVPGLVGKAVQFNGVNDRIVLGGLPVQTPNWTAEFILMKTGSVPTSEKLLRGAPFVIPGSSLDLEQFNATKQVGYTEFGAANLLFTPTYQAPQNEFIHLVFQRDTAGMHLYVNGDLKGNGETAVDLPRFQLGDNVTESILAVLDEVALYDRALSTAEINTHYRAISEPATVLGDANGDQAVNLNDFGILKSNFGRTWKGYGDANQDGEVNEEDIASLKVDYGKPVGGLNDFNGDGRVDVGDFVILKQGLGSRLGAAMGDLNGDGTVNLGDFGLLKQHFGSTGGAVPEPATLLAALEGLCLVVLAARLRRRS